MYMAYQSVFKLLNSLSHSRLKLEYSIKWNLWWLIVVFCMVTLAHVHYPIWGDCYGDCLKKWRTSLCVVICYFHQYHSRASHGGPQEHVGIFSQHGEDGERWCWLSLGKFMYRPPVKKEKHAIISAVTECIAQRSADIISPPPFVMSLEDLLAE